MGSNVVTAAVNVVAGFVPVIRTSNSAATDDRDKPGHDVERNAVGVHTWASGLF
jgi:hypothetical protein